jgi:hypothetical protein
MKFSGPSRVLAAIITIFSLLFTQLALASYACPGLNAAKPAMVAADAGDMPGCADMNMETPHPGLCHAHCEAGSQNVDTPQAPLVQPFVAAELTAVVSAPEPVASSHALQAHWVFLQRSAEPPLAIRHCCFRI